MSQKYEKISRVAASFLSAGGLAVLASRAEAQPDAVGHNSTPDLIKKGYRQVSTHEAARRPEQNAQAFIDSFDKRLAKEVQLMQSSPYFSSKKEEHLSKILHTVVTIDFVSAPSKQYPGRYDQILVVKVKGEDAPGSMGITLGSDTKSLESISHWMSQSSFVQVDDFGKFSRRTMSLESVGPLTRPVDIRYLVSSEGYPPPKTDGTDDIKYSDDPAKVSVAYNAFLSQIHNLATRR